MGWSLFGVIVIAVGILSVYTLTLANTYNDSVTKIPEGDAFPKSSVRPGPVSPKLAEAQNILLLGSDTRGEVGADLDSIRGQRSDTIMVVHVPADSSGIQVMSIMRDNWVTIPGYGEHKINAALAFGGVPLTVQTVESLIGVRIDHVAIVDFSGFTMLTNALGGVTVDNAVPFTRIAPPTRPARSLSTDHRRSASCGSATPSSTATTSASAISRPSSRGSSRRCSARTR